MLFYSVLIFFTSFFFPKFSVFGWSTEVVALTRSTKELLTGRQGDHLALNRGSPHHHSWNDVRDRNHVQKQMLGVVVKQEACSLQVSGGLDTRSVSIVEQVERGWEQVLLVRPTCRGLATNQ